MQPAHPNEIESVRFWCEWPREIELTLKAYSERMDAHENQICSVRDAGLHHVRDRRWTKTFGYVFKSRVAEDLRKAIAIVWNGGRFVSPNFALHFPTKRAGMQRR